MSFDAPKQAGVRRVESTAASQALAVIREAAQWASARGTPVREASELRDELYESAARRRELVLGYAGETPAATMLLQAEDPLYWPLDAPGTALYLHSAGLPQPSERRCGGFRTPGEPPPTGSRRASLGAYSLVPEIM